MSLWRHLTRGIHALTHRSSVDRDVADEIQHYLDEAAAEHMARGLTPEEARRAARIELGGVTAVREQVRGYGWENVLETLWADLRFALRRLRTEPGFTAIAILTLAVGLGGTTAIFSAVHPVLFEPLPYPDANRIAMIWEIARDGSRNEGTFGMYRELAARAPSLDAIAVVRPWQPAMTGPDQPERFNGQRVSASYLTVLGVAPVLGRDFLASDDRSGGPNVVVLSDALWWRRFGGDRAIVGRQIILDDNPHTVIGVMPSGFQNVLDPSAELWAPLQYDMSQGRAWGHHLRTVARLRSGVSLGQATSELTALGRAVLEELQPVTETDPQFASLFTYGREVDFLAVSLQEDLTRSVRPALLVILGAVVLVLVIACVNVTNLLIARDSRRHGEFALRLALGARPRRLVRQLVTETLLLAVMGGAAGMALAAFGVRALVALSPADLPRASAIGVDGVVFAFATSITTLVGLACGLVAAFYAARSDPRGALQRDSPRTSGSHRRTRSVLVVAEVALAFMLLVSSGLLLRSLQRLFAVEAGFDASHLLTMQVQTSGRRFDEDSTTYRFFAEALDAVRQTPGVAAAALTSQLPLSGDDDLYGVRFDPPVAGDPGEIRGTFRYTVSPGYFEAMGIPLRRGRLFGTADRAGAPRVAVLSESLVRRRLRGRDPIGLRIQVGVGPLYTVVGVVGDVKQQSLALNDAAAVYVTASQWRFADHAMSLVVRTQSGDPAVGLAATVRQAIWSVDKDQPIVRVAMMDDLLARSAAERRFALIVFEAFALAALLLAAAGIYGVLSGSVAERTREIGLRSAMGATPGNILTLLIRQGMTLTGFGVVIGVAGAAATTQVFTTLLFGLSRLDATTYVGVAALLGTVAMTACSVPAWRAARMDPANALRTE